MGEQSNPYAAKAKPSTATKIGLAKLINTTIRQVRRTRVNPDRLLSLATVKTARLLGQRVGSIKLSLGLPHPGWALTPVAGLVHGGSRGNLSNVTMQYFLCFPKARRAIMIPAFAK